MVLRYPPRHARGATNRQRDRGREVRSEEERHEHRAREPGRGEAGEVAD
jgi:hypothetical protein